MKSNFGYFNRVFNGGFTPIVKYKAVNSGFQLSRLDAPWWCDGKEGYRQKRLTPDTLVRWST